MNYKNMLKHAGMLCEYDDLTRDTSNDYAILDELKNSKIHILAMIFIGGMVLRMVRPVKMNL